MKVDFPAVGLRLDEIPAVVKKLEAIGYDGVLTGEGNHEPFYPLLLAAMNSERLSVGTGVVVAFAWSPVVTAHAAWDIQAVSGGRFSLGLGTQVKGHNERRFSVPWTAPGPRLREYVLALRAIWSCWQYGTKLDFRGQHYTHTLMPAAFSPEPIDHLHIPIYISAVLPYNCRLAGELCDGIRLHPISSPEYTRQVVLPCIADGARKAGRSAQDVDVCCVPLIATGADEAEVARNMVALRRAIARYASTRTYQPIFEQHGWGDVAPRLHTLSLQEKWAEMGDEISDEMAQTIGIVATYDRLAERIKARWGGIATRIAVNLPLRSEADEVWLRALVSALHD